MQGGPGRAGQAGEHTGRLGGGAGGAWLCNNCRGRGQRATAFQAGAGRAALARVKPEHKAPTPSPPLSPRRLKERVQHATRHTQGAAGGRPNSLKHASRCLAQRPAGAAPGLGSPLRRLPSESKNGCTSTRTGGIPGWLGAMAESTASKRCSTGAPTPVPPCAACMAGGSAGEAGGGPFGLASRDGQRGDDARARGRRVVQGAAARVAAFRRPNAEVHPVIV